MTTNTSFSCVYCGVACNPSQVSCGACHQPITQIGATITFNQDADGHTVWVANPAGDNSIDTPTDSAAEVEVTTKQVPHFKINEVLGFGGMGTVYRAQDLSLGRFVALKLFHNPGIAQRDGQQRLLAEARLACQLNHPNIVTIYDIARGEQTDFFVMEWVDGLPLNKLIPEHGFELPTALDYALQTLDGLACAHNSHIIHRDIKPQNIMVNHQNRIKILDFGIASLMQAAKEHAAEPVSGTWLYMAPEQLNGEPVDARADLFAFGVTFYEMLTGQKPFHGTSPNGLRCAIATSDCKAISAVKPNFPKALDTVVAKLLAADKAERYQSAEQVSQDLAAIHAALTSQKNWWQRRNLATQAVLVLPIIALLGFGLQQVLFPPSTQELVARQLVEAKKIAILPFDNISGDPTLQVFADAVLSSLGSDLTRIGYEQGDGSTWIIPVSEVRNLEQQTSKAVYDNYAADLVLTGSIQHLGSTRQVVLNLLSAADGRIVSTTELSIAADKLFEGQAQVREQVVRLLGWTVSDNLRTSFAAHRPQLDGAYKDYLDGMGYLYRFDQPQNLDKALAAFQRAIALDSGYTDAYVGLAKAQLTKYQDTRDSRWLVMMEQNITQLTKLNSNLPELTHLLGALYVEKGEYQDAIDEYLLSLQKHNTNVETYIRLAWAYSKLNQLDNAKATFEQAVKLAPNDVSVKLDFAMFYYRQGHYQQAIEKFSELVQKVPNHQFAYHNMAASYYLLGQIKQAILYTEKAISIDPNASSYANLGTMRFYQQDYRAAVDAYEHAIALNGQDFIDWGNLADGYRFAGSDKTKTTYLKAIALAKQALTINPNEPLTLSAIAYYLACAGDEAESLKYASQITPDHAGEYQFYVATAYATLGHTQQAIAHLTIALDKHYPLDEILTTPILAALRETSEFKQFASGLDKNSLY